MKRTTLFLLLLAVLSGCIVEDHYHADHPLCYDLASGRRLSRSELSALEHALEHRLLVDFNKRPVLRQPHRPRDAATASGTMVSGKSTAKGITSSSTAATLDQLIVLCRWRPKPERGTWTADRRERDRDGTIHKGLGDFSGPLQSIQNVRLSELGGGPFRGSLRKGSRLPAAPTTRFQSWHPTRFEASGSLRPAMTCSGR